MKGGYYTSLVCCKMNQGCRVTINTRKKCMACRFNKCLKAGEIIFFEILRSYLFFYEDLIFDIFQILTLILAMYQVFR